MQRLTHNNVEWIWSKEQEDASLKLKDKLADKPVMAYYDPNKSIKIIVDTSPMDFSALITQESKIITCASRALIPTQKFNIAELSEKHSQFSG